MPNYDSKITKKLSEMLKARFPYIYIPTWEEDRAIDMINSVITDPDKIKTVRQLYTWTITDGFVNNSMRCDPRTSEAANAIDFIRNCKDNAVFVLKDFHVLFGAKRTQLDYHAVRKLRDIIPHLKTSSVKKNVIFISPELIIPDEMQKEISIIDFPLPTIDEIRTHLDNMILENQSVVSIELTPEGREKIYKAALGLTLQEAENAFARAMVDGGKLCDSDVNVIFDEKNQVVKKTGVLEFIKSDISIDDIGGLDNLKLWLQKRKNSWLDSAKEYNLPPPKGVLITGVPGCGKSLTAKAMSAIWQLPLLYFDMGRVLSGIVGSSEENLRRALRTAEAVSPSVLWVDEIEKGFAGVSSIGDSGTSSRIFGTFLTWMQDKTDPVFVVATANDIGSLPPELLRKGRFDEIFFVDLPTFRERKVIFNLHLKKRLAGLNAAKRIKITDPLIERLAGMTEGFVGAEIEQTVIAALYEAFFENRALMESDLEFIIKNTVPLSVTRKEHIDGLREWANARAVCATAKEDLKSYTTEDGKDENTRGGRIIDFRRRYS